MKIISHWSQFQKHLFSSLVGRKVGTALLSETKLTKGAARPPLGGWIMSEQSPGHSKHKYVNIKIHKWLATGGVGANDFNIENTTH